MLAASGGTWCLDLRVRRSTIRDRQAGVSNWARSFAARPLSVEGSRRHTVGLERRHRTAHGACGIRK